MNTKQDIRIALLLPSLELGAYWQPVLDALRQICKHTILYTGHIWPGFDPTTPSAEAIEVIGKVSLIETKKSQKGYNRSFMILSPRIVNRLLSFKPNVVFASSYSLWTLLALLLKPICRWRLVIAYEGSAPNVDFRDSKFRTFCRKLISHFSDSFITNSLAGKNYLVDVLGVHPENIFARPYMVPHSKALMEQVETSKSCINKSQYLKFLYVGRIDARKGLDLLLQACALMQQKGFTNYKLQIIGTGQQRSELEEFAENQGLTERIEWLGWVDYGSLGQYFRDADVFVFPTLEDTWGMVVLEAMGFGKPVLCSKWAGASELILDNENGYLFDPYQPESLAKIMSHLIQNPHKIAPMSHKSKQIIAEHVPENAAKLFVDVASHVLQKRMP
jgi:glycosyltransferase involved in cell wall biosynthesis